MSSAESSRSLLISPAHPRTAHVPLDPQWVADTTFQCVEMFIETFNRYPTQKQIEDMAWAVVRYGLEPDGPSSRLH